MAEGRFYGLLMLSTALVIWVTVIASEKPTTPPYLYALFFLYHALLTTSHVLGIVYSATLLAGFGLLDLLQHRFRPLLYASAAAA